MSLMQEEITQITLDTMLGIRKGVGEARVWEFGEYVDDLIKAKDAGLDMEALPMPMLMDRTAQGIEATLARTAKGGVSGGVVWSIANIGGEYSRETQQGIRVKVDMEFMSAGAPDLNKLKEMSVDELRKLRELIA